MRAHPTADRYLTAFFGEPVLAEQFGAVAGRLECDLRFAAEIEGEALLGPDDAALLPLARQVEPARAVARVMDLPALVRLLTRFVLDPAYRSADLGEARGRVETCALLLQRLAAEPQLAGHAGAVRRAEEAIRLETGRLGRRPALG